MAAMNRCLFCGSEYVNYSDHLAYSCDGKQGRIEAAEPAPAADFDGATYEPARDHDRLHAQLSRVFDVLKDRQWHTLGELAGRTGDPEASISARIRDLRKDKFGGHVIDRRYVERGLFEYRLLDVVPAP